MRNKALLALCMLLIGVYIHEKFLFIGSLLVVIGLYITFLTPEEQIKKEKNDKGNYKKIR